MGYSSKQYPRALKDHGYGQLHVFPGELIDQFNVDANRAKYNMTSPHSNMPCLYADASVRCLGFKIPDHQTMARYWGYNDGNSSDED